MTWRVSATTVKSSRPTSSRKGHRKCNDFTRCVARVAGTMPSEEDDGVNLYSAPGARYAAQGACTAPGSNPTDPCVGRYYCLYFYRLREHDGQSNEVTLPGHTAHKSGSPHHRGGRRPWPEPHVCGRRPLGAHPASPRRDPLRTRPRGKSRGLGEPDMFGVSEQSGLLTWRSKQRRSVL